MKPVLKICLLVLVLAVPLSADAQKLPKAIKKFSVDTCGTSSLAIVDRKGMVGLFNFETNSFAVEPGANQFFHYERENLLFQTDEKKQFIVYNLAAKTKSALPCIWSKGYNEVEVLSDSVAYLIMNRRTGFASRTDTIPSDTVDVENYSPAEHYLRFVSSGDFVFIAVEKQTRIDPFAEPLKSLEDPLMDSLACFTEDGQPTTMWDAGMPGVYCEAVYPPPVPGFRWSEIYNIRTGEKVSEEEYVRFIRVGSQVLAQLNTYDDRGYELGGQFDLFVLNNGQLEKSTESTIKKTTDVPLEILMDGKKAWYDRDSTLIYFEENGKVGLLSFSLFASEYHLAPDYSQPKEYLFPKVEVDTIFKPQYEFVQSLGHRYPHFLALDSNEIVVKLLGYDSAYELPFRVKNKMSYVQTGEYNAEYDYYSEYRYEYYTIDTTSFQMSMSYEDCPVKDSCMKIIPQKVGGDAVERCTVEFLDSNRIYMSYFRPETQGVPLKAQEEFAAMDFMDSVICRYDDGTLATMWDWGMPGVTCETVYARGEPSSGWSGIYDLNKKEWILNCQCPEIVATDEGYYYREFETDTAYYWINERYNVIDGNGNSIMSNLKEEEFWKRLGTDYKFLIPKYKIDTAYVTGYYLTFLSDGKMGATDRTYISIAVDPADYAYFDARDEMKVMIQDGKVIMDSYGLQEIIDLKDRPYIKKGIVGYYTKGPAMYIDHGANIYMFEYKKNKEPVIATYPKAREEYPDFKIEKDQEIFEIMVVNDSLVYIKNYQEDFKEPLMSMEDPSMDSLICVNEDGSPASMWDWGMPGVDCEAVWSDIYPGYDRSGLYNFVSNEWIVKPFAHRIEFTNGEIIVHYNQRNSKGEDKGDEYSVLKLNGQKVMNLVPFDKLKPEHKEMFNED